MNSNLIPSQQLMTSNAETTMHNQEANASPDRNTGADRRITHRLIEEARRKVEHRHIDELRSLIPNWYTTTSPRLTELVLLQMAADLLERINSRYQHDPLLPSHLTADEAHFLNLEASNAFLFVTTIESTVFRIIHVTDSIQRVLHVAPADWCERDFFQLIHRDDLPHVYSQLASISRYIDNKPSFKCRVQQVNGSYSLVTISGTIKKTDQSLRPVLMNEDGFFVFVGICELPLASEYSDKNMHLYQNPRLLAFSCRCSPMDWKIFLVDCSVSTFPSISFDFFRDKSILEFIQADERPYVHEHLLNSTLTGKDELVQCHFVYSPTEILFMVLQIKPLVNSSTKKTDCVELTFDHILNHIENPNETAESIN